eukprot:scaffold542_cov23-Tisochrysis_lutea.AAC.1
MSAYRAMYSKPQGCQYALSQIREQSTNLYDELARVAQVSDTHNEALVDCPALQTARRCECSEVNLAGNLQVDIAAAYGLVFTTGHVQGDDGQVRWYPTGNTGLSVTGVPNVDWTLYPHHDHLCRMGRCASEMSLLWKPERQYAYVDELERNLEMP